jgi:hypothetical protein
VIVIYITPRGTQGRLESADDCAKALHLGLLSSRSQVYHEASGIWVPAMDHPGLAAYFPKTPEVAPPWYDRWLVILCVLLWLGGLAVPPALTAWKGGDVALVATGTSAGVFMCALFGLAILRVMRLLTGRQRISWLLWGMVGGVAFCLYDVVVLPKLLADQQRLHASARSLQDAFRRLQSGGGTSAPPSVPAPAAAPSPATLSRGAQIPDAKRSQMLDAAAQLIADSRAAENQYIKSLDGLSLTTLLGPETLLDKARRRAGADRLDAWERALTVYERDGGQLVASCESKMKELGGVSDGAATARWRSMMVINRSIISETRLLYDFVGRRAAKVRLKGGKLKFSTDADQDAYRTHMARIQELDRESADLNREMQQKRDEATAHLREMAQSAAAE